MSRGRDINDIDEDEEGQIVDYSDDENKSKEKLSEDAFRRRPAPDLGVVDTFQPLKFSVLRGDDEILVRSRVRRLCLRELNFLRRPLI